METLSNTYVIQLSRNELFDIYISVDERIENIREELASGEYKSEIRVKYLEEYTLPRLTDLRFELYTSLGLD